MENHEAKRLVYKMFFDRLVASNKLEEGTTCEELEDEVYNFINDPQEYIDNPNKSINAQQVIAIAKAVCLAIKFLDENICPVVLDLP